MNNPTYMHNQTIDTAAAVTIAPCSGDFANKRRLGQDFALAMGFAR